MLLGRAASEMHIRVSLFSAGLTISTDRPQHLTRHIPDLGGELRIDLHTIGFRYVEHRGHHPGFLTLPMRTETVEDRPHRQIVAEHPCRESLHSPDLRGD